MGVRKRAARERGSEAADWGRLATALDKKKTPLSTLSLSHWLDPRETGVVPISASITCLCFRDLSNIEERKKPSCLFFFSQQAKPQEQPWSLILSLHTRGLLLLLPPPLLLRRRPMMLQALRNRVTRSLRMYKAANQRSEKKRKPEKRKKERKKQLLFSLSLSSLLHLPPAAPHPTFIAPAPPRGVS